MLNVGIAVGKLKIAIAVPLPKAQHGLLVGLLRLAFLSGVLLTGIIRDAEELAHINNRQGRNVKRHHAGYFAHGGACIRPQKDEALPCLEGREKFFIDLTLTGEVAFDRAFDFDGVPRFNRDINTHGPLNREARSVLAHDCGRRRCRYYRQAGIALRHLSPLGGQLVDEYVGELRAEFGRVSLGRAGLADHG